MTTEREIVFYRHYFLDFHLAQTLFVQKKIEYVLWMIKTIRHVPDKFLKHMSGTDGIYEVRIECAGNIYRIFCCFDKGNLVVLFNAFQKKTQKTPKQELALAEQLRQDYFKSKKERK